MNRKYLGDSYDAVKRMWRDMFVDWAPLYAAPRFIPNDLQSEFTLLTRIPIFFGRPEGPFSIFNDPDTGVRLPDEANQSEGRTHITVHTIAGQVHNGASCVITFDQSNYRNKGMQLGDQRSTKMLSLAENGCHSFYYVSHAPFLFAAANASVILTIRTILTNAGIPNNKLKGLDGNI
jgi:hypothetical protein